MSEKQRNLVGMYFYDILPEDVEQAISLGIKPLKSGKWALKKYDTSSRAFANNYNRANEMFGEGIWWAPSKLNETTPPTVGKISQVSGDKVTVDAQSAPGVTTKTTLPLSKLIKDPKTGKLSLNMPALSTNTTNAQASKPMPGQPVQISNDIADIKKLSGLA